MQELGPTIRILMVERANLLEDGILFYQLSNPGIYFGILLVDFFA